jgi:hypothetical protein
MTATAAEAPAEACVGADHLRAAFVALRDAELRWLRALPPARQRQLRDFGGGAHVTGAHWPAHTATHAGEVALVLLGAKPCVLLMIGWPGSEAEPSFSAALVAEVLAPWLREFGLSAGGGFSLHACTSASVPPRSWLLLAERHALAPLVRATFLGAPAARCSEAQRGIALGYPGSLSVHGACGDADADASAFVYYMARDDAPYRHVDGAGVARALPAWAAGVPLLEYGAAPCEAAAVGAHFRAAADATRSRLGVRLTLNTESAFLRDWPDHAVAACWRAAFGGREGTRAALLPGGELRRFAWMSDALIEDVLACMPPS